MTSESGSQSQDAVISSLKSTSRDLVSDGKYVLLRRGDQERILEFKTQDTVKYGRGSGLQEIELKNASGCLFYSTFRVKQRIDNGNSNSQKRIYYLEPVSDPTEPVFQTDRTVSGKDNRNIVDDNKSQPLGSTDIATLREKGVSGPEILDSLISNSKTFGQKTEYAQEKYLKKKERAYGDLLVFLKPSLTSIAEYYYKKDPAKVMNLRTDTLSQLLSYANIHAGGKYMVYETGCSGLVVASVLQRLGGNGTCLHVHTGSTPQRQALFYMNFTSEELESLQTLDVFYVTRPPLPPRSTALSEEPISGEPEAKKAKTQEEPSDMNPVKKVGSVSRADNEKSILVFNSTKFDGLLICSKEHPLTILQNLLPRLASSAPFVVFCQYPEPLEECYMWLKESNVGVNVNLVENWFRNIQVESERTHPEINMSSTGGYLLFGIYVRY